MILLASLAFVLSADRKCAHSGSFSSALALSPSQMMSTASMSTVGLVKAIAAHFHAVERGPQLAVVALNRVAEHGSDGGERRSDEGNHDRVGECADRVGSGSLHNEPVHHLDLAEGAQLELREPAAQQAEACCSRTMLPPPRLRASAL